MRLPARPALVTGLLLGDLVLALGFLANMALGLGDTGLIARQLHPAQEGNLPTWYASLQWAVAAALLAIYARFPPRDLPSGRRLLLPVVGALLLSLDESASLHEWIGQRIDVLLPGGTRTDTPFWSSGIWALILVPPLVIAAVWVGRLLREHLRAAPVARSLMAIGGAVFLLGAAGVELAANLAPGPGPARLGLSVLEEVLELLGGTLVVLGAWELVRTSGIRIGLR